MLNPFPIVWVKANARLLWISQLGYLSFVFKASFLYLLLPSTTSEILSSPHDHVAFAEKYRIQQMTQSHVFLRNPHDLLSLIPIPTSLSCTTITHIPFSQPQQRMTPLGRIISPTKDPMNDRRNSSIS